MMSIVKDFLLQVSLIAALIFIYQIFLENRFATSKYVRAVHAFLFGLSILLCMSFRAHISHTFYLDIRIVPLLLGTLYGGWRTGLFLSTVIILYRLYLGANLGLDTTVLALLFSMPVFIAFQKLFVRATRNRKLQISIGLSVYYLLVGLFLVHFVEGIPYGGFQAALIQMTVTVLSVSFFVSLNEMIKETLARNQQLQFEVKEAEIAFLRAQINPHFLYNALNSISALCDIDPKRAGETTDELAHYLRSRFDFRNMERVVSLKKELEYVNSYINVEKARFGEGLQVKYQIDDRVDWWIPPLIVQPIVENAVKHGLQYKQTGGLVTIVVEQTGADAEIRISDNGKGMEQKKMEQILTGAVQSGVGLKNVDARLKKLYGKGLSIVSEQGKGTTVIIRIPMCSQL
jgi:sensor histidine kinase YesM